MYGQFRIEKVFAFVVVDTDGTEGVPAVKVGPMVLPLLGADLKRIESLMPIVKNWVMENNRPVTLYVFENRTEVKTISPGDLT